ncbi:hypothetical protein ZIOFF_015425 [Zingiber officinale]|uniref:Uncharacterized protein n=1 Tax=Zingiber officinale TaxID=94328 RepID=A0A8J5HUH6_ZINOF|nr:hypothetical protein ZIOFF_015425 [Zingiber officinale]
MQGDTKLTENINHARTEMKGIQLYMPIPGAVVNDHCGPRSSVHGGRGTKNQPWGFGEREIAHSSGAIGRNSGRALGLCFAVAELPWEAEVQNYRQSLQSSSVAAPLTRCPNTIVVLCWFTPTVASGVRLRESCESGFGVKLARLAAPPSSGHHSGNNYSDCDSTEEGKLGLPARVLHRAETSIPIRKLSQGKPLNHFLLFNTLLADLGPAFIVERIELLDLGVDQSFNVPTISSGWLAGSGWGKVEVNPLIWRSLSEKKRLLDLKKQFHAIPRLRSHKGPRTLVVAAAGISTAVSEAMAAKWAQKTVVVPAQRRGCHLITPKIVEEIQQDLSGFKCGLAHLFLQHTSASLTINENYDSDVQSDTETFLNRIVPEGRSAPWKHTLEGE